MLHRCQEAVALSKQKEADIAGLAKLEGEHNRQTIDGLTQQNTDLLARNDVSISLEYSYFQDCANLMP